MTTQHASAVAEPAFGSGLYSFPVAARIIGSRPTELKVTAHRLRYWLDAGLTPVTFGRSESGSAVLSFFDLVSLEVVRLFREAGASLQLVRALEVGLRQKYPELARPFAHKVFYTDGVTVWQQLKPNDDDLTEILGKRLNQISWKGPVAAFASEIDYRDGLAAIWHLSPWVEIDPDVHFGAPVVRGTSVPVSTVAANLRAGTPEQVADWYGLDVEQVNGVKEYLDAA